MTDAEERDPPRSEEVDTTSTDAASSPLVDLEESDILRLLVRTVRDYAIFALDPTGHVMTWNAGAQRLKGYTRDEILGKHFSIFYPPDAIVRRHPEYELMVASSEGRFEEEGWRIRKDGSRFWANVVITALRDGAGTLVGFAKVTRDLSERKRVEEAVKQSEQRLRLLVQSVRDYGIFMLDPVGHVESWNAGAASIYGYDTGIIGRHFSVFYPSEDLAKGKPEMELREARVTGRYEDEGWRVRSDGTRFWANVIITSLWSDNGELIGFAKVTRDLTERRAAEERALMDARRLAEAEASNRAKAQFLAAMSHELRTPLNAIGGYADLLSLGIHGPITEQQRDALQRIRASQQHLLGLITDLLNFTRLEAGRITYELRPVRLADVALAIRPMVEPQALAKNIAIDWQEPDATVIAIADRPKVEQILLNLLTNAVKYTDPGGHVTVRHYVLDDRAVLEVRDDGIGISPDQIEAIFEPFVQVGRSLTSPHEGAGLGLAISRDLARAMRGDLTVVSEVNDGSIFTLALPRV